jgi:hypothetical protein
MGKLTISMAIFNSYVKLPEGNNRWVFSYFPCRSLVGTLEQGELARGRAVAGTEQRKRGSEGWPPIGQHWLCYNYGIIITYVAP